MSVIDYTRKSLSPYIWAGDKLQPHVRAFIMGILKQTFPNFVGAYILGSITTPNWSESSDIDINVVYPNKTDIKPLEEIASKFGKQKLTIPGTPHVLGFYVTREKDVKDDVSKSVGAFNLVNSTWVKQPTPLYVDPQRDEKRFQKEIAPVDAGLGELSRDIKDIRIIINTFKQAPEGEKLRMLQHLEDKKKEVEEDLKALTDDYDEFHQERLKAFESEMGRNRDAGRKHLLNQTLPGNVIFKMMERYGYRDLLERLRDIYKELPRSI